MAEINITIKNMPQIRRAFGMAPTLMTKELNTAIKESVFTIERESKIRTPVDTGFLRSSHRTVFGNLRGEVGPTATYGIFVHEGTRFMRGRPFLRNAVETSDNKVQKFFKDAVQRVLDRIAKET